MFSAGVIIRGRRGTPANEFDIGGFITRWLKGAFASQHKTLLTKMINHTNTRMLIDSCAAKFALVRI